MAELIVDLSKLRRNLEVVQALCTRHGIELVVVAKGCNGFLPAMRIFAENGGRMVGFSRVEDACRVSSSLSRRPCFVSIPSPGQAEAVVQQFCFSLHSELLTIQALARAGEGLLRPHGIILMVDIGDLREGVVPEEVVRTVRSILEMRSPSITLWGLGATLGCCSGTLPDEQNLGLLQELLIETEQRTGTPLKTLSLGGSVVIPWLEKGLLPSKINQVRIGEAILLGNIPTLDQRHPALSPDVFMLRGTVLEAKEKPSLPPGQQGKDVFGQQQTFTDRGYRLRCILDFGILDTYPRGLTPLMRGLDFINSNSDYTIVDTTETGRKFKPGDTIDFRLNYQALIRAFHACNLRITVKDAQQGGET
jgi:ornithine racemase